MSWPERAQKVYMQPYEYSAESERQLKRCRRQRQTQKHTECSRQAERHIQQLAPVIWLLVIFTKNQTICFSNIA